MPKDSGFKERDFREAVRNILQGYRKEYLALGDTLVESVLQKFNDGIPVTRAVEDAIRDVGFFGANAQAVSQMLFLAACAGYGVLPKFVAVPSEADIKRKLTETAWTGDGMKLSKRLHALPVRNNIVSALGIALRQVKSIKDIAMELYDGYNSGKGILSKATLRKDMAKLLRTAEAALGDSALMSDLRRQALRIESQAHGIQSPRLQAVYNELVKACTADELKAAAIKRAAWAAVEEKTRYHAERIARTEAARAWFDGYIAARENDEDIWGYRWQLSSRHHLCPFDQCDVCANMDVGYGKGIYPKHKVPSIPRHPHCMCMLEDVFAWERKGKRIKPEGARRYIDSLDEKRKRALFGDAGLEAYEKGGDWQKLLRGWDGFKKPKSRLSAGDFKFDLQLFGAKNPLPNFEKAVIPSEKIFGYALNKQHAKGGPKAIAFEKALGYNIKNGEQLIANIRQCLPLLECTTIRRAPYGIQYSGDVIMQGINGKTAKVRVAWQIDYGEEIPHLTSVYVTS